MNEARGSMIVRVTGLAVAFALAVGGCGKSDDSSSSTKNDVSQRDIFWRNIFERHGDELSVDVGGHSGLLVTLGQVKRPTGG